jgi:hypothetical protein
VFWLWVSVGLLVHRCSFFLQPCEGTSLQILTQGKLSAPRILRMHKVECLYFWPSQSCDAVRMMISGLQSFCRDQLFFHDEFELLGNTTPAWYCRHNGSHSADWMQVANYVLEKLVPDRPLEDSASEGVSTAGQQGSQQAVGNSYGSHRPGSRVWQPVKPVVEVLCNNQVFAMKWSLLQFHLLKDLSSLAILISSESFRLALHVFFDIFQLLKLQVLPPEMSLATVRAYIWKKPEDLYLHYRIAPSQ